MLTEQTVDKLNALKLGAMADAFQKQLDTDEAVALSFEERLGLLVDTEWTGLRDQTFFELGALNRTIRVLLDELNDRPLKKLGVSRRALYEQLDRPALRPLPTARYVLAHWKLGRVNIDYHVEVDRHLYSVPYHWSGTHSVVAPPKYSTMWMWASTQSASCWVAVASA